MIKALKRKQYFRNARARIAISRQPIQQTIGQHRHEFFEIAIILSGHGLHVTGKLRHPIGAGDVLIVNNRRAHGYESNDNLNLVNILIDEGLMAQVGRRLREVSAFHALFSLESVRWQQKEYKSRLTLTADQLEQVENWLNHLEEELRRGDDASLLAAEAWLTLIISLLVNHYDRQPRRIARPDTHLGQLLGWLEKNCAGPLTIGDMARQTGMSERSFYRAFRAAVGRTPSVYLTEARIRRAMDYMSAANHEVRISEVAALSGFDDSNYFSRVFRQVTGQSPRQYLRTRHRGNRPPY
jgi:AraC-like DNA-binding protein